MAMPKNLAEWIEQINLFVYQYRLYFIIGLASLLVIGGGYWGYETYRKSVEAKVSVEVNHLSLQAMQILQGGELNLSAQDTLAQIQGDLNKLYQKNKWTSNGKRALFLAANGDFRAGQTQAAREKYLTVYKSDRRHYLAPQALLFAAQTLEEEGQSAEAIKLLKDFERTYPGHFLFGEAQLTLSRNLLLNNQGDQALAVLDKLSQNRNLPYYASRAQEQKRVMAIKGGPVKNSPALPNLPRPPGS
ncbi:MAG: tetratricopeptide repeat protein [Spirochaetia bacterium]|nr:tetratricopeptide repeat protein [Spirochaetia bacterium]